MYLCISYIYIYISYIIIIYLNDRQHNSEPTSQKRLPLEYSRTALYLVCILNTLYTHIYTTLKAHNSTTKKGGQQTNITQHLEWETYQLHLSSIRNITSRTLKSKLSRCRKAGRRFSCALAASSPASRPSPCPASRGALALASIIQYSPAKSKVTPSRIMYHSKEAALKTQPHTRPAKSPGLPFWMMFYDV